MAVCQVSSALASFGIDEVPTVEEIAKIEVTAHRSPWDHWDPEEMARVKAAVRWADQ